MLPKIARRLAPIALGLAALATTPAFAATVYESASFTGTDTGETIVQDGHLVGAAFTLTQATAITGIGGQFGGFPSGTIFGAIVPLASISDYPAADSEDLASIAIAHTVFAVTNSAPEDVIAPIAATLQAGTYAVIFGSGQFGADGWAGLGEQNSDIGTPTLFQTVFDDTWQPESDGGIRILVQGSAVPEPASWAMMLGGFALVGGALRSRRKAQLRFG